MRRRGLRGPKLLLTGLAMALLLLGLAPAGASSANISHAYHASTTITNGSIVSLDPERSDYVQPSNSNNGTRLIGVASNDSLLAVDPASGAVQVATSGTANTLVSTINGDIKVGDQVAVSPFDGVGMKAVAGSYVVGLAQTGLNSKSANTTTREVTDKKGQTSQVKVGYVRLSIAIGTGTNGSGSQALSGLQKLGRSLTGHTISTVRVAVSLVVASVALLALVTLIYASIYGSIISIGRNPLAKYAVFRTLGSVLAVAALTAVIAGVTIFLILR